MGVAIAVSIGVNALVLYGAGSFALTAAARPLTHGITLPVRLLAQDLPAEPTPNKSAVAPVPQHRVVVPSEPEKQEIAKATSAPKDEEKPIASSAVSQVLPDPASRSMPDVPREEPKAISLSAKANVPARPFAESDTAPAAVSGAAVARPADAAPAAGVIGGLTFRTVETAGGGTPESPQGGTLRYASPTALAASGQSGIKIASLTAKTASPTRVASELAPGLVSRGAELTAAGVSPRAGSAAEAIGGLQIAILPAVTATEGVPTPRETRDVVRSVTGSAAPRYGRRDTGFANKSTETAFIAPIGNGSRSNVTAPAQKAPSPGIMHEAVGNATEIRTIPLAGNSEPGSGPNEVRAGVRALSLIGSSGRVPVGQSRVLTGKGGNDGTGVITMEAAGAAGARHVGGINGRTAANGSINANSSGPGTLDAVNLSPQATISNQPKLHIAAVSSDSDLDADPVSRSIAQVAANVVTRPAFDVPDALRAKRLHTTLKVRVVIEADGRHTEEMVASSGDDRMDRAVLAWMRGWKWEAAQQDGKPVRSTRLQKVNIGQD